MKILVATSDKYAFLAEPYAVLFNKYWPNQEIVFLGFDRSRVSSLPDNCVFHSLGTQADFGKLWSDPLIPFIENLEDEYFVFTMEDMVLMDHVDTEQMAVLEKEIKSGRASKAILDCHLNKHCNPHTEGLIALDQKALYRTTLHPAMWRKEYFVKYLKPGLTPWDFEIQNMPESQSDGATIIALAQDKNLYYTSNVYRQGEPFPRYHCPRPYGTSGEMVNHEDVDYILSFIRKQTHL